MLTAAAFVALAGAGAVVRWMLAGRLPIAAGVPLSTLVPNAIGAFALGLLVGVDAPTFTVVGIGGLGSLTSFSTFARDTIAAGSKAGAATNVVVTCGLCVAAAYAGLRLAG